MKLTPEQLDRLKNVTGLGKPVSVRNKENQQPIELGLIDDVVSECSDGENKFEIQRIRCTSGDLVVRPAT